MPRGKVLARRESLVPRKARLCNVTQEHFANACDGAPQCSQRHASRQSSPNPSPDLSEVDPEEELKVDERFVVCVYKLSPPSCKDVQQPKEVCVELSIRSRDALREGEAYDCIVVPVTVPLVMHAKFKG